MTLLRNRPSPLELSCLSEVPEFAPPGRPTRASSSAPTQASNSMLVTVERHSPTTLGTANQRPQARHP
jgi:hypothetical protein